MTLNVTLFQKSVSRRAGVGRIDTYYSNGIGHLVTMFGLESDEDGHVLDDNLEVIPGLYVAGNVQGDRFAIIYPEVMQGQSVAMAMTYGYIAGKNVAMGK